MELQKLQKTSSTENSKSFKCEICKDTEVIFCKDEQGISFVRECSCKKINDSKRRLARTALANKADKYKLDTYIATEQWQKSILSSAVSFINNFKDNWYYIGGQVGSGKTHICTGITLELSFNHSLSFDYILFNKKMTELKQIKFSNDEDKKEKYRENMQRLFEIDILFIDDLYKIEPSRADLDILFDIINERYLSNKTCIISSEKTIKEIFSYDEAIASRIFEKCGEYAIGIAKDINKNYRLKSLDTL